jgi:hypothetical protein
MASLRATLKTQTERDAVPEPQHQAEHTNPGTYRHRRYLREFPSRYT